MATSFLKRGREAKRAFEKAEAVAEARALQNTARRFWVPRDGESLITFLDGDLRKDGLLDVPSYNEHRLKLNGHWRNWFPCTADEESCPICEQGDTPQLVTLFTVLDHAKWKDRKGKKHQHERRLFVAKSDTLKTLQKMAAKRGGLTGWRVSISRHGDRSPEVGSAFDFLEQYDIEALRDALKLSEEGVQPFNYEEVVRYYTADELRDLGFGQNVMGQHDRSRVSRKRRDEVDEDDDADDDDDALAKARIRSAADEDDEQPKAKKKAKAKPVVEDDEDDDDDDIPAGKPPVKKAATKPPFDTDDDEDEDAADDEDADDADEEEEIPPPKKKGGLKFLNRAGKKSPSKPAPADDEDEDDEE